MDNRSRQAGDETEEVLSRYSIARVRFDEARSVLMRFDRDRDDAELFLLGLIPVLLGNLPAENGKLAN